jgi:hypothetical protein
MYKSSDDRPLAFERKKAFPIPDFSLYAMRFGGKIILIYIEKCPGKGKTFCGR